MFDIKSIPKDSQLRDVLDNVSTEELESLFPGVIFLDPGAYCSGLLEESAVGQNRMLTIEVTGKVVSKARVTEFAKSYLNNGSIVL